MRVTLDTGILARATGNATGPAKRLLGMLASTGSHVLVLSPFILEELRRVLLYPRLQRLHGFTAEQVSLHVDSVRAVAEIVIPTPGPPIVLNDPDDDPVVYTAIEGKVQTLCTLDRAFYAPAVRSFCAGHGIEIMSDVELLQLLDAEAAAPAEEP